MFNKDKNRNEHNKVSRQLALIEIVINKVKECL
jgi:hypothetical protein